MRSSHWIVGEVLGTFLLVLFGCGSVATAVALDAQVGLFQVAIVWGFGLSLAILITGPLSGAHLNPAITLAMMAFRGFPANRGIGYIAAQFCGAFAAAVAIFLIYGGGIEHFESTHGIVRGETGSEASAMIFGEFYPNPNGAPLEADARERITRLHAWLAEFAGTALLALVVFAITDPRRRLVPEKAIPFVIGLALTTLISLFAPVSMGGFNPARDLAPRIFSTFAGWGTLPFELNGSGWLVVYVIAPIAGALAGGLLNKLIPVAPASD